ncbi:hypothetical protein JS756_29985 [Streptomyces actuosus]|uniref:Uncharacterized protein n=2 Tax=Streptomyces actuosus TaxID=1885 RepID=A0ABS2VYN8_STRAS|nr:hypothetical protein [Streptomyces actuosus]
MEEQMRDLLAEDAYTIQPSPVPYPAIRRQGASERRRRVAIAGAAIVALGALPVGAYALGGTDRGGSDTAAPRPTAGAPQDTATSASPATSPAASPSPTGPARPTTDGQLLDGIGFAQAAHGLQQCLDYDEESKKDLREDSPARKDGGLGTASDYRIILAMHSTGDSNAPGDGFFVVAVKEQPRLTRLICNIRDGRAQGLNASVGGTRDDTGQPVSADINSGKLYQQSVLDNGHWKLPFRWGLIGTVQPSVAKVTVDYGDSSSEAALDHGWFVASGTLGRQVTRAPHVKGFDAAGKLVYDSDLDKSYEKTLP